MILSQKSSFSRFFRLLPCIAALAGLNGCATTSPASDLPQAPKNVAPALIPAPSLPPYQLQVGDVLDVKFLLNPELNEQAVVRPDGMISTSVAQDVPAYGHTPSELQAELEKRYKSQLKEPHVNIIVRSFAPTRVYVTGEVVNPGEFITVGPTLTLLQAISRAGGLKNTATLEKIVIIRRGAGEQPQAYTTDYIDAATGKDPASDVRLAPYDVVFVPRSGVGDVYYGYNQYLQQFVPFNFGFSYQINHDAYR